MWLATGELDQAARWVERSGLAVDDELSFVRDLEHVNLARVLAAQGMQHPKSSFLDDALNLLARLLSKAGSKGWVTRTIEIQVLQALTLAAQGRLNSAADALAQALRLAEPQGYVRIFIDEGAPLGELLRQAAARPAITIFANKLLTILESELVTLGLGDIHLAPSSGGPPVSMVEPLTGRELEVLRLLATDLSSTEIARELFISVNTTRSHIQHIYAKLEAHSRFEAVSRARELDLLN